MNSLAYILLITLSETCADYNKPSNNPLTLTYLPPREINGNSLKNKKLYE
jgi:hypothetical protein